MEKCSDEIALLEKAPESKKKPEADLAKIRSLFNKSMDELNKYYINNLKKFELLDFKNPEKVLEVIYIAKKKFRELSEAYEFNEPNKEFFKDKTAKLIDLEEKIRKENNLDIILTVLEINKQIEILNGKMLQKRKDNLAEVFGSDPYL